MDDYSHWTNRYILIIDDNLSIHEDFKKILSKVVNEDRLTGILEQSLFGEESQVNITRIFELDSAFQGDEAVKMVEYAYREKKPYALAFVDVRMPPGIDGIETITRLWKIDPHIQIVVCTAYSDYSLEELHHRLGSKSDSLMILKKPFDSIVIQQMALALVGKWNITYELRAKNYFLKKEIDERKKVEHSLKKYAEKLQKSRKRLQKMNTSKDKLFSIISHDLRNPFNSLVGFTELLISRAERLSTEQIQKYANRVHSSANNLFNLIDKLLLWSRYQLGKMEFKPIKINLQEIVVERLQSFVKEVSKKNIAISCVVDGAHIVFVDYEMLNSIIHNLISNAINFSNDGGEIIILSSEIDNYIKISIIDKGIGIDRDVIKTLFNIDTQYTTYSTEEEKGIGLGLVLCKEFVEKNGGRIWVESNQGKETLFHFTLLKA